MRPNNYKIALLIKDRLERHPNTEGIMKSLKAGVISTIVIQITEELDYQDEQDR